MNQGEIVQIDTPEKIVLNPKNDFVKEFFKGEGILTILARKPAIDYAEAQSLEEEPLERDASLRDALVAMLSSGKDRLSLVNGSISWENILSIAGSDTDENK